MAQVARLYLPDEERRRAGKGGRRWTPGNLETHNNGVITTWGGKERVDRCRGSMCRTHRRYRRSALCLQVHGGGGGERGEGGWMWRKADVTMNTVYICRCAATWDGSQINTFLLLATPSPPASVLLLLLLRYHLLSPLCSPFSRYPTKTHPFRVSLFLPPRATLKFRPSLLAPPSVTSCERVTSLTSPPRLRLRPRDRLCRCWGELADNEPEFSG